MSINVYTLPDKGKAKVCTCINPERYLYKPGVCICINKSAHIYNSLYVPTGQHDLEEVHREVRYDSCCGLDVHARTVVACRIKRGQKELRLLKRRIPYQERGSEELTQHQLVRQRRRLVKKLEALGVTVTLARGGPAGGVAWQEGLIS